MNLLWWLLLAGPATVCDVMPRLPSYHQKMVEVTGWLRSDYHTFAVEQFGECQRGYETRDRRWGEGIDMRWPTGPTVEHEYRQVKIEFQPRVETEKKIRDAQRHLKYKPAGKRIKITVRGLLLVARERTEGTLYVAPQGFGHGSVLPAQLLLESVISAEVVYGSVW